MTEVKSDEALLLTKRKPDPVSLDKDNTKDKVDDLNKKQKLVISSTDNSNLLVPEAEGVNGKEDIDIQAGKRKIMEEDEDDEDEEDYEAQGEDDDEEGDSDDSDGDNSNGNAEVLDLKGKGIMMDEKGKGKLIEESEDSSECGSESDGDSDLSDDPLTEVDLDNILPTRTRSRSRVVQPGIHITDNQGSKEDNNDGIGDH